MLKGMPYGTYILFGLLTYIGAAFIWLVVPETKRLSLEEMVSYMPSLVGLEFTDTVLLQDLVFGSEGTAQAETERMEAINREIGLSSILNQEQGESATGKETKMMA